MTCVGRGNERLIHSKQGASPNRGNDDVEAGSFLREGGIGGDFLALPNGLF
jgi:hypothetical protein